MLAILLIKITVRQNEVTHSYHKVRVLYFLAVTYLATIFIYFIILQIRHLPTDIFQPTSSNRHLPTDIFQPASSNRHLPTDIFQPTSSNRHLPTDIFQPTSSNRHLPTGIFQPTSSNRHLPTDIFQPTSSNRINIIVVPAQVGGSAA